MDTKRQNQRNKLKIMYNLSLKFFIMKRYIFNLMIAAVMALSLSACMKFDINERKENNSPKEQRDDNSGKPDEGNKETGDQDKQKPSRHATGLVIDPSRNVENSYGTHIFEKEEILPPYKRLPFPENLFNLPYSYDQGAWGSCSAMASSMCVSFMLNYKKRNMSFSEKYFMLSPSYLYNQKKLSSDCRTAGSIIEDVLDLIIQKGIPPIEVFPYNDKQSCSIYPNQKQDRIASLSKIKGYNSIELDEYQFKAAINKGYPIIIGARVNDRFDYLYDQGKSYIYKTSDYLYDTNYSNHAMLCVGYQDTDDGGYLIVANSWYKGGYQKKGYVMIAQNLIGEMIKRAIIVDEVYDVYEPLIDLEKDKPIPNPKPIPQPQPEPKPNPIPEPQPTPIPEPKPIPQPQPEPKPNPIPEPQPTPIPEPKPIPQPQPEPKPNPIPEPQPTPIPEPKPRYMIREIRPSSNLREAYCGDNSMGVTYAGHVGIDENGCIVEEIGNQLQVTLKVVKIDDKPIFFNKGLLCPKIGKEFCTRIYTEHPYSPGREAIYATFSMDKDQDTIWVLCKSSNGYRFYTKVKVVRR